MTDWRLLVKGLAVTVLMPHVWILIWLLARDEGKRVRDVLREGWNG